MSIFDSNFKARQINFRQEQADYNSNLEIAKKEDTFYALDDDIELTPEQIAEIDKFWGKYEFMGKIDYRAFRTFYNRSGIFDPKYLPHYFVKYFIKPNTAPEKYATAFQNKAYINKLLTGVKQPEVIGYRVEGIYFDKDYNHIDLETQTKMCMDVLESGQEIVVKPSGLAGGKGVEFISETTYDDMKNLLRNKGRLFVIQKAIHQHPVMKKLNESTVNTVRLTTFMYKGKFYPMAALIKVGAPNVRVDNYKHGGCLIGVHMDGTANNWALNVERERITELPSRIDLAAGDFPEVPCFDNVLKTAERAHYNIPKIKMISWDIAIDDQNEAEIIEANFGGDLRMHQVLTGPVFGDMTEKIIDYYALRKFSKPGITADLDYSEYSDHVVINKYYGKGSSYKIPAEINGKPVTELDSYAFSYHPELKTVDIPDTVKRLRDHAFFGCRKLSKVNVNLEVMRKTDSSAFNRCNNLDRDFKYKLYDM